MRRPAGLRSPDLRASDPGAAGAEAQFTRLGEQQFDVVLTYPSGVTQRYALRGDDWQVDARVLKWRGAANVLGFDTAYRLERIGGRYADIDRERARDPHRDTR